MEYTASVRLGITDDDVACKLSFSAICKGRHLPNYGITMRSNSETQQPGTQVLRRIGQILRFVAEHNRDGARLTDVAGALELEPPTAHRLLRGLVNERMIQFEEGSKRYRLGPELYELGWAAASRFDLIEFIAPSIQRLVDATG